MRRVTLVGFAVARCVDLAYVLRASLAGRMFQRPSTLCDSVLEARVDARYS